MGAALLVAAACVPVPGNQRPTAAFTATPASGAAPLLVQFDAGPSTDEDGSIVEWSWNFGDGTFATGATASHEFAGGTFVVTLTVVDDGGAFATATRQITAGSQDLFEPVSELTGVQAASHFVDLDADGDTDIVGERRVYLANGDGTFTPGLSLQSTRFVEVHDVNNDGAPDLLAYDGAKLTCNNLTGVCWYAGTANGLVYVNDGAAAFTLSATIPGPRVRGDLRSDGKPGHSSFASGDVNGDGVIDLVAGPFGGSVYLGVGDGTFVDSPLPASTGFGAPAELGDVDGDGDLDVWNPGNGRVMLGDGDGGFAERPSSVSCDCRFADVDQDGAAELFGFELVPTGGGQQVDVVVADWVGDSFDTPVRARVDGVDWQAPAGGRAPREVSTVGDMTADGVPDLVVVSGGALIVAVGGPGVTLDRVTVSDIGSTAARVRPAVGDLNADGFADVAVWGSDEITTVLTNDGAGSFSVQSSWAGRAGVVGHPPAIFDVDGDGYADLVRQIQGEFDRVQHGPGATEGPGSVARVIPGAGTAATLEVGDLDDDGRADVVVRGGQQLEIFLGRTDGRLVPTATIGPLSASFVVRSLSDVDQDGNVDLVATDAGEIVTFLGDGTGELATPLTSSSGAVGSYVELGDVNGDSHLDAVGKSADGDGLWIAAGLGDGTFAAAATAPFPDIDRFALGDIDNDAVDEIVLNANLQVSNNVWTDDTHVLRLDAFGVLQPFGPSIAQVGRSWPTLVDLDGDGWTDLVSGTLRAEGVNPVTVYSGTTVRLGDGTGAFPTVLGRQLDGPCAEQPYADLDGDGLLDAVTCGARHRVTVESGVGRAAAPRPDRQFAFEARGYGALGDQNGDGLIDFFSLVDWLNTGAPALVLYRGVPAG